MSEQFEDKDAKDYAEAYRQHATTLRNWFVAYGVGGPAVLLTNEKLQLALKSSGSYALVGWFFLAGVALQVLLAFVDKYADWICYWRCEKAPPAAPPQAPPPLTLSQRLAAWWVQDNRPSIALDLASMAFLAFATGTAFYALAR
jgi:hypothetical protein